MNVLRACEESQAVCKAFREKGHQAFSCDILPCSGDHPEWHIQGDVLHILNPHMCWKPWEEYGYGIQFETMDGKYHFIPNRWDLIIAHPPCTYLTNSGNRWFNVDRYGQEAIDRHKKRKEAIIFFMAIANADCERIVIENPIGHMSKAWRKPDQIIQPWQFALSEEENTIKSTCLWLQGVPALKPLHTEQPEIKYFTWYDEKAGRTKKQSLWYYQTRCLPAEEKAKAASKTFPGIAKAMTEQWG